MYLPFHYIENCVGTSRLYHFKDGSYLFQLISWIVGLETEYEVMCNSEIVADGISFIRMCT